MWGGSYQTYSGTSYSYTYSPNCQGSVSYTHLRAHETVLDLVCRLLLEKNKEMYTLHEIVLTFTKKKQSATKSRGATTCIARDSDIKT